MTFGVPAATHSRVFISHF